MKRNLTLGIIGGGIALAASLFATTGAVNAGSCYATSEGISCSLSSPNGIKSIYIAVQTPDGVVPVWDEQYDCESPIGVFWEHKGKVAAFEVVECDPGVGVGGGQGLDKISAEPTPPPPPPRPGSLKILGR